jgi:uncharacterized alkaline shock family protein YloU
VAVDRDLGELTERIAEAIVGVPGVAFLRPGLSGLLRASAGGRGEPSSKGARSAVRIRRAASPKSLAIEVSVVLRSSPRAIDLTRAVRAAVLETVQAHAGAEVKVHVTITVTGLI